MPEIQKHAHVCTVVMDVYDVMIKRTVLTVSQIMLLLRNGIALSVTQLTECIPSKAFLTVPNVKLHRVDVGLFTV